MTKKKVTEIVTTTKAASKRAASTGKPKTAKKAVKKVAVKTVKKTYHKDGKKQIFTTLCVTDEAKKIFLEKRDKRVKSTGLKKHVVTLQMIEEIK